MLGRSELLDLFGQLDGMLAGNVLHDLLVACGAALALQTERGYSIFLDMALSVH